MPRRPRIAFPGATYHMMGRGNHKAAIFHDARDYRRFLQLLRDAVQKYDAICYGYSLMGNHYHLVLCTPRGNISAIGERLNGLYARYLNWRLGLTGHQFEARFVSIVIGDDRYLANALAYVARNPLEAGFVSDPEHWPWSSYPAVMGRCRPLSFLDTTWLPSLCPADSLKGSRGMFKAIVERASGDYLDEAVVASPATKRMVRSVIGRELYRVHVPRSFRALGQPPLHVLFGGIRKRDRRTSILRAHVVHGYRMADIARYLDLHPTTVSRIVRGSGGYSLIRD